MLSSRISYFFISSIAIASRTADFVARWHSSSPWCTEQEQTRGSPLFRQGKKKKMKKKRRGKKKKMKKKRRGKKSNREKTKEKERAKRKQRRVGRNKTKLSVWPIRDFVLYRFGNLSISMICKKPWQTTAFRWRFKKYISHLSFLRSFYLNPKSAGDLEKASIIRVPTNSPTISAFRAFSRCWPNLDSISCCSAIWEQ